MARLGRRLMPDCRGLYRARTRFKSYAWRLARQRGSHTTLLATTDFDVAGPQRSPYVSQRRMEAPKSIPTPGAVFCPASG